MTAISPKTPNFPEALKRAIKFSGYRKADIARRVGMGSAAFSLKLNERNDCFNAQEIKCILITLAELQGINHREDFINMLRLAGLREAAFSQEDWRRAPLSELD